MPNLPTTREEAEKVLRDIERDGGPGFGISDLVAVFRSNTGPARYFIKRMQGDDPRGFEVEAIRIAADQMAEEIESFIEEVSVWEKWEAAVEIIGDRAEARTIACSSAPQESEA